MRHDFIVILRRGQSRRTELAGFCLLLFCFLAFLFTSVRTRLDPPFPGIAACLMMAGLVLNGLAMRRGKPARFTYWLLAAATGWALMPYGRWIFFVLLLFALLEARAAVPLTIAFSPEDITVNSLPKRRISWSELQSVMLKDGLLTMDFKNNRLLQREVSGEPDEQAFNASAQEWLSNG